MSQIVEILTQSSFENKEIWISEAKFSFKYLQSFCKELKLGSAVLEIGCGSGILMGMLSEENESVEFEGVEPFGDGFQSLSKLNSFLKDNGMIIHEVGYENYELNKKYDLIYLVNVFEHLYNWGDFLEYVERHLTENGVCVILCPNYNVPYESHFRIPILFNKHITGKVFRKFIVSYENTHNFLGLWKSLNFVKLSEVKTRIKDMHLSLSINHKITEDLIDRLAKDEELKKKQRLVGFTGTVMKKFGVTKAFSFELFENLHPI